MESNNQEKPVQPEPTEQTLTNDNSGPLTKNGSENLPSSSLGAHTGAIKKKKDEKKTKKDQRSLDNLLKSVSHLADSDKLVVIKEKYAALYTDYRTSLSSLKTAEKQLRATIREKEHIQSDLAKYILSKSKLESLARELQKQNKEIKEENINKLREEEEKRREVAANFSEKLSTLTELMDENKDKSIRLRDENVNITSKFTELYNQFQERETHLANMNRQMELQKQLTAAQIKKIEFEFETEREIWKKEKTMLLSNLDKSNERNKILQESLTSLQDHLNTYQQQYSDFESTMQRSNKVFDTFKEEIANMQKAKFELEQDRNEWHNRWKLSLQKCVELSESKNKIAEEFNNLKKKTDALEKLCRKLTAERSYYMKQLRLRHITPISPVEEEAILGGPPVVSPTKSMALDVSEDSANTSYNLTIDSNAASSSSNTSPHSSQESSQYPVESEAPLNVSQKPDLNELNNSDQSINQSHPNQSHSDQSQSPRFYVETLKMDANSSPSGSSMMAFSEDDMEVVKSTRGSATNKWDPFEVIENDQRKYFKENKEEENEEDWSASGVLSPDQQKKTDDTLFTLNDDDNRNEAVHKNGDEGGNRDKAEAYNRDYNEAGNRDDDEEDDTRDEEDEADDRDKTEAYNRDDDEAGNRDEDKIDTLFTLNDDDNRDEAVYKNGDEGGNRDKAEADNRDYNEAGNRDDDEEDDTRDEDEVNDENDNESDDQNNDEDESDNEDENDDEERIVHIH